MRSPKAENQYGGIVMMGMDYLLGETHGESSNVCNLPARRQTVAAGDFSADNHDETDRN